MAGKKKKKRRPSRAIDSKRKLAEAPGSGIEPGQGLDEAESIEESAKLKKAVKAAEPEKRIEKAAKKPGAKKQSAWAGMKKFFKDVQAEAKKIVWPDSEQQKNSTIVVVVTILALAAFMGLFSKIFYNVSDYVFLPDTGSMAAEAEQPPGMEGTPEEGEGDVGGEAGGGAPGGAEGTS